MSWNGLARHRAQKDKQGPYLFVSPSGQKNKYTVKYCKEYCDQQFNDCTGFIKTSSVCKFMSSESKCTGTGKGSLAYYNRTATADVTKAPTIAPTASPTASPTESPTVPPTDSPTRYYGEYELEWTAKVCAEGSKQGPYLFVSPSGQKNKYTVDYCKIYCDQQFNDCTGFIKTSAVCKFMSSESECSAGAKGTGTSYYNRTRTLEKTDAPTAPPTNSPTAPTASPTEAPTEAPTDSPTRYYGTYKLEWSGKASCTEKDKQGPYLFVSPGGQKNKYTVKYCKEYCDQQFNDCTGFIKTSSQCKFMSSESKCTGTGKGSLAYYNRTATADVTKAPTIAPTASPTASPTKAPTEAPTDSPTRYYGEYELEWTAKACKEGSKQGPYLFVSPSGQKNKYTVEYCQEYCDQQFNDCTGFIKTGSQCKFMSNETKCSEGAKGTGTKYYNRTATKEVTSAPTKEPTTAVPTASPTTGAPTRYFGNYTASFEGKAGCQQKESNQKMLAKFTDGQNLTVLELECDHNDLCTGVLKTPTGGKLLKADSKCVPKTAKGDYSLYMRVGSRTKTTAPTNEPTASPTASPTPTDPTPTKAPTKAATKTPTVTPGTPTDAPTDKPVGPTNAPTVDDDDGMSGGAKAGIAIGVIVGIAAAGAGIMMLGKKSDDAAMQKDSETEIVASPDGKVTGHAPHDAL